MGRAPCCSKVGLNRGSWTDKEDALLTNYIQHHGEGHWRHLPKNAGLLRCGKSCRLRWVNYLRPDINRENIAPDEEDLIIRLHALLGNRWSLIAKRLPGRTDNQIKNYWSAHLSKRFDKITTTSSDHPKSSKKAKKTNEKKKKKKKKEMNQETAKEEPEKTKIYLPKAIRVSPYYLLTIRNSSFDSTIESATSSSWSGLKEANDHAVRGQTTSDFEGIIISDHACDISSLDFSKLFEEYEQLLKSEDQPSQV